MIEVIYSSGNILYGILLFVVLAAALMFSIVLHEVSHGVVALWNGDSTAKVNGRLTLNPFKHFDPLGAIMILFVGFGYARPVPVNPYNFRHYRKGLFLVSIAGVTTNIIIAFLGSGFFVLMNKLYLRSGAIGLYLLSVFFEYLSWFNIVLCFFNILPLFPLDGFNVISALCKRENKFIRFMRSYGQYILLALIIVSFMVSNISNAMGGNSILRYFSPLDLYFDYTARYVDMGFNKLWSLIFGGI